MNLVGANFSTSYIFQILLNIWMTGGYFFVVFALEKRNMVVKEFYPLLLPADFILDAHIISIPLSHLI